jgi:hypothetical protein
VFFDRKFVLEELKKLMPLVVRDMAFLSTSYLPGPGFLTFSEGFDVRILLDWARGIV